MYARGAVVSRSEKTTEEDEEQGLRRGRPDRVGVNAEHRVRGEERREDKEEG